MARKLLLKPAFRCILGADRRGCKKKKSKYLKISPRKLQYVKHKWKRHALITV